MSIHVVFEQIVNEYIIVYILVDYLLFSILVEYVIVVNNCFSINQLVGQNIILKKPTKGPVSEYL